MVMSSVSLVRDRSYAQTFVIPLGSTSAHTFCEIIIGKGKVEPIGVGPSTFSSTFSPMGQMSELKWRPGPWYQDLP